MRSGQRKRSARAERFTVHGCGMSEVYYEDAAIGNGLRLPRSPHGEKTHLMAADLTVNRKL